MRAVGTAISATGLEGLADWISSNYSGMGKSAMDVMPELRRKGITASGRNFSMGGQILDAPAIAAALRLQVSQAVIAQRVLPWCRSGSANLIRNW